MSTLKYICLSDLHLGADYSLLTWMGEDGKVDLLQPSETLVALGTALRQYVKKLSGPVPPTLVLMGDVLDLGQSPYGEVVQGFRRFVEALFPAGEPLVFSTELITVPGNHDHHLWSTAQDQHLLEQLVPAAGKDVIPGQQVIPVRRESTPLFGSGHWHCSLLTSVMRGYPHLRETHVDLAYPNHGFLNADGSRGVVLHHGHYVDATYLAMSALNAQMKGMQGTRGRPKKIDSVERQNGAWVDFLFSDLGSSGAVGKDVVTLYETLRDAGASHAFSQQLSARLLKMLSGNLGVGANTEIAYGITVANVVKAMVDVTVVRGAESERDSYSRVMSTEALADLRWYLSGPVQQQLKDEGRFSGLDHLSFVFGHTHKPFQDQLSVAGYAHPVCIYNTGGWVLDQPTMTPTQGAAAVFIDDQMNLASLRLFNDPVNGKFAPVRAAGVGGFEDQDNPLLARMNEALLPSAAAWEAFSTQARAAAERHARVLLQTFFTPPPSQ